MNLLSLKLQDDLINQIYNKAQDLDVAILNYVLGDDTFYLDALSLFQNKDGGFGHNLYIDNYNLNSTAYTSYYALKLLYLYKNDNKQKQLMLNRVLTYLYHKAIYVNDLLIKVTSDNDNYAHSSYFNYVNEGDLSLTCGVIGLTLLSTDNKSPYNKLAVEKYQKIKNTINKINQIDLAILIAGLDKRNIKHNYTLNEDELNINNIVEINEYLAVNKELLERALNNLVLTINNNGLWDVKLNWGNNYPEQATAEIKWCFRRTVMNFYYLKKYKLVESN